jgi:hypothetical protein
MLSCIHSLAVQATWSMTALLLLTSNYKLWGGLFVGTSLYFVACRRRHTDELWPHAVGAYVEPHTSPVGS